ncbi:MAG: hypothetical protein DYG98_22035 [Haliscomenobacteraceae bacterium CHB4]|nr:hypothetical protein [Saprospiraceae bacterium]MCE7925741.1 hypothetical protein [Haliscomenobacteraceae bacterium CHB4]
MEKSRLLRLLRTLSKEELRGLKKFVRNPFFNQRSEVPALLDVLEKSLKTDRTAPGKEQTYRQIFGKEAYNDHRVRLAMSFLYQLTGQFLAVQDFLQDSPRYQRRLASIFRRRHLPDQFAKTWEDANAAQQRIPVRNADFFEENYQLLLEKHRFAVETQTFGDLDFQELSDRLDNAFLARKLWQACFMLSHQSVSGTVYRFGLLDAALAHIGQTNALDIPAISIYYHCYRALTDPAEKVHFQQFKFHLTQSADLFPPEELRDLYILAINFCIRQYNAGNQDYLAEQFELYQEGFAKKYFLTEGSLSRYTYQNAATIGLVLHELEWVERFVHDYRPALKEEQREGLFSFNLARLEYQRRDLGKALQFLQKAEYKDLMLSLAAKTLQMKIFYELQEFDLLESHLQAIRAFIRRKKVMGYHRENYLNTVNFTQKLLETNLYDKEERAALRREIEATKAVAEKEWLLKMMNDE